MNSATPVVFLHGLGLDRHCWTPQIEALHAQGIPCHAWEMPGHGGAPWDGQPMSFAGLAAALTEFLDTQKIAMAHLVGHSMGGMLALELAATAPARCCSLTLIGSSAMFGSADGSFQRAFLAERLGPLDAGQRLADLAPALVADLCLPTTAPDLIAACVEAMARMDEAAYRAALACLVTFDRRAALAGLTMPVLCLAGEHDRQAPAQGVERMAGKIPGARFLTIRNAAHLMSLEAPEAVTQALGDFIAEGSA
jgi:pimeloyl-ACP methyl ester carboxylesterase